MAVVDGRAAALMDMDESRCAFYKVNTNYRKSNWRYGMEKGGSILGSYSQVGERIWYFGVEK